MSTLPCLRSSASVTEKPLDTLISILGNSSLRIRVAGASHAASCPVRKPTAKIALAGRAARRRQFDAAHAAHEKRSADFLLEVPHLAAEGWLRRMQAAFRRELHAPSLSDGDEITKVPQLHASGALYLLGISVNLQSLFQRGHAPLFKRRTARMACGWASGAQSDGLRDGFAPNGSSVIEGGMSLVYGLGPPCRVALRVPWRAPDRHRRLTFRA